MICTMMCYDPLLIYQDSWTLTRVFYVQSYFMIMSHISLDSTIFFQIIHIILILASYVYIYIHIYIYICIHIHIHKHIYPYIYIHWIDLVIIRLPIHSQLNIHVPSILSWLAYLLNDMYHDVLWPAINLPRFVDTNKSILCTIIFHDHVSYLIRFYNIFPHHTYYTNSSIICICIYIYIYIYVYIYIYINIYIHIYIYIHWIDLVIIRLPIHSQLNIHVPSILSWLAYLLNDMYHDVLWPAINLPRFVDTNKSILCTIIFHDHVSYLIRFYKIFPDHTYYTNSSIIIYIYNIHIYIYT